jgi:hypothetical protein
MVTKTLLTLLISRQMEPNNNVGHPKKIILALYNYFEPY